MFIRSSFQILPFRLPVGNGLRLLFSEVLAKNKLSDDILTPDPAFVNRISCFLKPKILVFNTERKQFSA
ncbi:MAG TPA: hypothetical protein DEV98_09605 [Clostridiales bacterium]|nr:hypothetical protein [Clostridiales bacterium]